MKSIDLLLLAAMESNEAVRQLISLSGHKIQNIERDAALVRNYARYLLWCAESEQNEAPPRLDEQR